MTADAPHEQVAWPVLIGHLVLAKQRLAELRKTLPFVPPRLGASEEAIAAVEQRWGPLEPDHRDFLSYVDGWEDFHFGTPLLDTAAIIDPANAQALATYFEQCEIEPDEVDVDHVMPLSSEAGLDYVLMLGRAGTPEAGQVIRFRPSLREQRFTSFRDYFLFCIESYENALQRSGGTPVAPVVERFENLGGHAADNVRGDAALSASPPARRWK